MKKNRRGRKSICENKPYDNKKIIALSGKMVGHVNEKRINWYLTRGLASRIDDDTIILNFEPKWKGEVSRRGLKPNYCIVCGSTEQLTRHHILPTCFVKRMTKDEQKNYMIII